ncbi:MAG: hypothetical protein ACRCSP_03945 [Rhodoglobus sp.]
MAVGRDDNTTPPARVDLERLLESAVHSAKRCLTEASEFDPFALVIDHDGRLLAAEINLTKVTKHPDYDELAEATATQLRAIAPTVRSSALTVNTRLSERKTDAVEVRLEHQEGVALLVFLPYKRPMFGGNIAYGDLISYPGSCEIWS